MPGCGTRTRNSSGPTGSVSAAPSGILGHLAPGSRATASTAFHSEGGFVVAANHFASLDHPLIGINSPRARSHYMAKAELLDMPVIGQLLDLDGRFSGQARAWPTARRCARRAGSSAKDMSSGVHVEGTRQKFGYPGEAKLGGMMIAMQESAPIVPCAVETFKWNAKTNRRACSVVWGNPIATDGFSRDRSGLHRADRGGDSGDLQALATGRRGGGAAASRASSRTVRSASSPTSSRSSRTAVRPRPELRTTSASSSTAGRRDTSTRSGCRPPGPASGPGPAARAGTAGAAVDGPPRAPALQRRLHQPRGLVEHAPELLVGRLGDGPPRRDARVPERFGLPQVADPGNDALVEEDIAERPTPVDAPEPCGLDALGEDVRPEPWRCGRGRARARGRSRGPPPARGRAARARAGRRASSPRERRSSARACAGGCGRRRRRRTRAGGSCRRRAPRAAGVRPPARRRPLRADAAPPPRTSSPTSGWMRRAAR